METLREGVELMYRQSDAFGLGFELYIRSLLGQVKPEEEPVSLLTRALQRSSAECLEV